MKTISLTPNESVPIRELAKVLAIKALEFLTSQTLSIELGVVAFIAVMLYQATGDHPTLMAATVMAWAIHLATLATIDIAKGGASKL